MGEFLKIIGGFVVGFLAVGLVLLGWFCSTPAGGRTAAIINWAATYGVMWVFIGVVIVLAVVVQAAILTWLVGLPAGSPPALALSTLLGLLLAGVIPFLIFAFGGGNPPSLLLAGVVAAVSLAVIAVRVWRSWRRMRAGGRHE